MSLRSLILSKFRLTYNNCACFVIQFDVLIMCTLCSDHIRLMFIISLWRVLSKSSLLSILKYAVSSWLYSTYCATKPQNPVLLCNGNTVIGDQPLLTPHASVFLSLWELQSCSQLPWNHIFTFHMNKITCSSSFCAWLISPSTISLHHPCFHMTDSCLIVYNVPLSIFITFFYPFMAS
jgi:hypothetical protein